MKHLLLLFILLGSAFCGCNRNIDGSETVRGKYWRFNDSINKYTWLGLDNRFSKTQQDSMYKEYRKYYDSFRYYWGIISQEMVKEHTQEYIKP